jgi:hypothetical protein
MSLSEAEVLAVLSIGHDTSMRGEGVSMSEALERIDYPTLRARIVPGELLSMLNARPNLVQQWLAYSEDKRTEAGWYVTSAGEIGTVVTPPAKLKFSSLEEAVAAYVLRELDFWADLIRSVPRA